MVSTGLASRPADMEFLFFSRFFSGILPFILYWCWWDRVSLFWLGIWMDGRTGGLRCFINGFVSSLFPILSSRDCYDLAGWFFCYFLVIFTSSQHVLFTLFFKFIFLILHRQGLSAISYLFRCLGRHVSWLRPADRRRAIVDCVW